MGGVKEGRCGHGGLSQSSRRRWLSVLALALALAGTCGEPAYAQSRTGLESLREPLTILRQNSSEIVTRSLMQEQLMSDLQSEIESLQQLSSEQQRDNERSTTLLGEQRADLQTQREALGISRDSHDATSKSWTNYLQLSEEEIQHQERRVRRNRLAWQIGVPAATAAGIIAGVLISREVNDEPS